MNRFALTSVALACGLALSQTAAAVTLGSSIINPTEDVMTSSFFTGTNLVRGYPGDNRPVMRVSTDAAFGNAGGETIYLAFSAADFAGFGGPVAATLTMQSTAGGFNADASAGNPFTVSAHAVNADPLASITDDTNPTGPIHWLDFYNNNILAADSAASTVINGFGAVSFDVSAIVNNWIGGSNTVFAIAMTGKNDTSSADFLHGFVNNNDSAAAFGSTYLTVTAVPEAETWAMLLAGLGMTGWMVRRKRQPG
jgi:hypothetical protein